MKNQKGITMVSLVLYIIVMIIILGVISSILNNFYKNNGAMKEITEEILEFNKFNTYFLKEVKLKDNAIDTIDNSNKYILFKSGNSFSFSDEIIYYNNIPICTEVKEFTIEQGKDKDGNDDATIVYVEIKFEKFAKSMNYKIEEIY